MSAYVSESSNNCSITSNNLKVFKSNKYVCFFICVFFLVVHLRPAGSMDRASAFGNFFLKDMCTAEGSGFESQVGRFCSEIPHYWLVF